MKSYVHPFFTNDHDSLGDGWQSSLSPTQTPPPSLPPILLQPLPVLVSQPTDAWGQLNKSSRSPSTSHHIAPHVPPMDVTTHQHAATNTPHHDHCPLVTLHYSQLPSIPEGMAWAHGLTPHVDWPNQANGTFSLFNPQSIAKLHHYAYISPKGNTKNEKN